MVCTVQVPSPLSVPSLKLQPDRNAGDGHRDVADVIVRVGQGEVDRRAGDAGGGQSVICSDIWYTQRRYVRVVRKYRNEHGRSAVTIGVRVVVQGDLVARSDITSEYASTNTPPSNVPF